jgi:type I restriction enzyme R subunit
MRTSDLLYRLPYNDLNPDVKAAFESNRFSVTRQVHYSVADPLKSVDMVLFINGLALATLELKNPWTGQNVNHAKKQYREDRDPNETLFHFRRCLVHFAGDPDEVWMTTKVDGVGTYFLPFNQGQPNGAGKGNPPNPFGPKSAYLWADVLTRQSLCNIIEHFAKVVEEVDKETKKTSTILYFPRYHQLQVVRKLLRSGAAAKAWAVATSSSTARAPAKATASPGWPTSSSNSTRARGRRTSSTP